MKLDELKDTLIDKATKCFLCRWILQDLHENGILTDTHPEQGPCFTGKLFPIEGKVAHLKLEGLSKPDTTV